MNCKENIKKIFALFAAIAVLMTAIPFSGVTSQAAAKKASKITLNKSSATMLAGNTLKLRVKKASPSGVSKAVTWKTSNKKRATVTAGGVVKAKKAGTVRITAVSKTNPKAKASCKITIYNKTKKLQLISSKSYTMSVGVSMQLEARVTSPASRTQPVRWTSSNAEVASISKTGLVKAVSKGTAKMTAKSGGKSVSVNITVEDTVIHEAGYIVTFDTAGGSAVASQSVTGGRTAVKPADPVREGYTFGGWYMDSALTAAYDFALPVTGNLTLYAKWDTVSSVTCKVVFQTNGGNAITEQTVRTGEKVTKPEDPVKSGFEFAGWYTDSFLKKTYDFDVAVTQDITLYARWRNTGNGSAGGSTYVPSTNPSPSPSPIVYTVTFDSNGGSTVASQTVTAGEKAVKPEDPAREGYTFAGWFEDEALSKAFDFSASLSSSLTLYAKYIPLVIYYEVAFVSNGVSDAENMPSVQTVKSGEYAMVPSAPIRSGYTFNGWYIDEELTHEYDFKTVVAANITLYAKWTPVNPSPIDPDTQYKVSFVLNDGSDGIYEIQTVNVNGTVQEPSAPVREQYRFTGWYTEAETAAEYNFNTPVTGNFILYAGWGNPDGSNEGIYSVSSGGGTEASISGIERSTDEVVYVTLNTPESSTVVVEFLDETEFWASEGMENDLTAIQGIAAQTPNYCEMELVSIPLEDVSDLLPQYYVLRARLYGQNGDELCDPFYSIQYTSVYEKFDNLTIQDRIDEYGTDRVIAFDTEESDSNYGVFAEDIKFVETGNSINILSVAYEFPENSMFPTTTYSFANPSAEVSALQKGDKLYALDKDGYPQIFKVGAIQTIDDGSVVITPDEGVILSDFYTVLKVDMDGANADVQMQNGIQPQLEIIDVDQTFSKAINHSIDWQPLKKVDNKGHVTGDWLKLTGSVGGKATFSIKLAWDAKLFQKDYFEASASVGVEVALKASIDATGGPSWDVMDKVNAEWKAGKVSVPTNVPGLTLFLETSVPVDLKFSGTGTLSATATLQGGFSFNTTSGFHPTGQAELKSDVNFTAQAELKAGPKVAVGVEFLKKVVRTDVSAQAGLNVALSGSVGAEATTGDSKHGCALCLKGDIKWFKNAKTSLSYDITKKISAKHEKTIYEAETALGIGKIYVSLIHDGAESVFVDKNGNPKTGPVVGMGDCPNQVWRTIFKAEDSGGNDIAVALNVNRQDGRIGKSGTTSFDEFLNNGVYTASGEIDGLTVRKSFTVNGAKQTVVLTPTSTDRSLSGIITDADTSNAIEEADIVAKQDDMIVASTKSSADGAYTLNLPEGSYVLEVSKTDYVTNTVHVTILNDREAYQNVELTSGENGKGGFSGRIVDASSGDPIEGVQLKVRSGWNASSTSRVVLDLETNANGEYKYEKPIIFGHVVGLAAGGYTVTASKEGYNTKSFNITVLPDVQNNLQPEEPLSRHIQVESGSYRIVLTWGANPRDLDSHVVGQLNSGNNFHVYFRHKNQMDGSNIVCNLDRDDTRGNGTETIVLNPQNDRPYYYYIYKYAGTSDIAHSGAHIDVYDSNGLIDSFNAPTDQGSGRYWNVFAIVDGQMIIQNTINDSTNISYAGVSDVSAFGIDELEQLNLSIEDNSPKNIENSEIGESSNEIEGAIGSDVSEATANPDVPDDDVDRG